MLSVALAISAFAQTGIIFFILIYPYRERLTLPVLSIIPLLFGYSLIFVVPFLTLGWVPYGTGFWRIFYSCMSIFLQSLIISYLIKIRLSIILFALYAIRNLTDSLRMAIMFFRDLIGRNTVLAETLAPYLFVLLFCLLALALIPYIRKNFKSTSELFVLNIWRLLWTVPFIYYIFFRVFSSPGYSGNTVELNDPTLLLSLIWFFGTMISHYVVLKMMNETAQTVSLKEQLKYFELLNGIQKREYDSLQGNISATRKFRHDLRHHIVAIDGYLVIPDVDGARAYLNSLTATLNSQELKLYSSNYAINSLLNYYDEKANEAGIRFHVSQGIHILASVPEVDFCTILGNLLENALEGCLRNKVTDPFITVKMGQAGDKMTVLSIKNAYSGSIRRKKQGFLSSKRETEGIGTASVRYLVEKYHGVCNFTYDNNVFEVSILLNPY